MFFGCTSLINAPLLPATTLAYCCYCHMFENCSSLISTPSILPATTLADSCYSCMFAFCSSLQTTPELPATNLADSCYTSMFRQTGITNAPNLPATTLAYNCYSYMFRDCISLINAPTMSATIIIPICKINFNII